MRGPVLTILTDQGNYERKKVKYIPTNVNAQ